MPSVLPLLAVVHDRGSASGVDILFSARKLCRVVFICDGGLPPGADTADQLREVAEVCDVTGLSTDAAIAEVAGLGAEGIVTFSEYQLERTARMAAGLGLPFTSIRTAQALTDKQQQRDVLRLHGVQSTRCRTIRSVAEVADALSEVGLPAVIKPRSGAGSVDTCRVDSEAAAIAAMTQFLADGVGGPHAEYVAEELLVGDPGVAGPSFGDYVSVESVIFNGEIRHVCLTGKLPLVEPFRETGHILPATVSEDTAVRVLALADAALSSFDIGWGVTHSEIKLTPEGPRLIEVNGRVGGHIGSILRRATGFDLVRAALEVALGIRPELPRLRFDRVHYTCYLTMPMDGTRFLGLSGEDGVRQLDGVWNVAVRAQPGESANWRQGLTRPLVVVQGSAVDHDGVRQSVDAIRRMIDIQYA